MHQGQETKSPFNSPLEVGLRVLVILNETFPTRLDLQRLMLFDHLLIHSGDFGGPPSLHAPVPLRTSEILVKRDLVKRAINMFLVKNLLSTEYNSEGQYYYVTDIAPMFVENLSAQYVRDMRSRAAWVVREFTDADDEEIRRSIGEVLSVWVSEFENLDTGRLKEGGPDEN